MAAREAGTAAEILQRSTHDVAARLLLKAGPRAATHRELDHCAVTEVDGCAGRAHVVTGSRAARRVARALTVVVRRQQAEPPGAKSARAEHVVAPAHGAGHQGGAGDGTKCEGARHGKCSAQLACSRWRLPTQCPPPMLVGKRGSYYEEYLRSRGVRCGGSGAVGAGAGAGCERPGRRRDSRSPRGRSRAPTWTKTAS